MGHNLDLTHMIGAPKTLTCPKCGVDVDPAFYDYDIEAGRVDPNPAPGEWSLRCYCFECDHHWTHEIKLVAADVLANAEAEWRREIDAERKLHLGDHEVIAALTGLTQAHMWKPDQAKAWREMHAPRAKEQRDALEARFRDWYENGPDPLLVGDNVEVFGYTDRWEHAVGCYYNTTKLRDLIKEYEAKGWQVCGCTDGIVIFKRPAPLEGPDDEG